MQTCPSTLSEAVNALALAWHAQMLRLYVDLYGILVSRHLHPILAILHAAITST